MRILTKDIVMKILSAEKSTYIAMGTKHKKSAWNLLKASGVTPEMTFNGRKLTLVPTRSGEIAFAITTIK